MSDTVTRRRPRRIAAAALTALTAALVPPVAAHAATPPAPPSDAKLAAEPARHDATREQFYFVLPDRFAGGDTANDRGDLKGLTGRLDCIGGLGTVGL